MEMSHPIQKSLPPLVYRGAREICGAVGVSWKDINFFVSKKGMPAFKIGGGGVATPEDLKAWVIAQKESRE